MDNSRVSHAGQRLFSKSSVMEYSVWLSLCQNRGCHAAIAVADVAVTSIASRVIILAMTESFTVI